MKTIFRMMIIALVSLISGVLVNQFAPGGIRWQRLVSPVHDDAASRVFTMISAESAFLLHKYPDTQFIDIRSREDFRMDRVPGARSFPYSIVLSDTFLRGILHHEKIIIYDFDPESENAETAAGMALSLGFEQVFIMHGGFAEWLGGGYPVENGAVE